jgi:hypothetical protein
MTDHLDADDPILAGLFDAATAPAEAPLPGELAALAAFRAQTAPLRRHRRPAALMAAAAFGGAVMVGGVAAAATGSMPLLGSHRDRLVVPHSVPASATHSASTTQLGRAPGARRVAAAVPTGQAGDHGKGSVITPLAHQNDAKGEHGATVCPVASDGACKAGQVKPSRTPKPHPTNDSAGKAAGHSATPKPRPTHPTAPEQTPKPHPTPPGAHLSHG